MDRPILFSAPMVHALLDGRKTQTRRIVKRPTDHFHASYTHLHNDGERFVWSDGRGGCQRSAKVAAQAGDRLWVREAWRTYSTLDKDPPRNLEGIRVWYEADDGYKPKSRLRAGIHMPRWASRLTLTVTDVRVQRLQDISVEDAEAEGVFVPEAQYAQQGERAPVFAYSALWNQINGAGSWETNPWVAAYTFTVEHRNIDALPSGADHG